MKAKNCRLPVSIWNPSSCWLPIQVLQHQIFLVLRAGWLWCSVASRKGEPCLADNLWWSCAEMRIVLWLISYRFESLPSLPQNSVCFTQGSGPVPWERVLSGSNSGGSAQSGWTGHFFINKNDLLKLMLKYSAIILKVCTLLIWKIQPTCQFLSQNLCVLPRITLTQYSFQHEALVLSPLLVFFLYSSYNLPHIGACIHPQSTYMGTIHMGACMCSSLSQITSNR